MEVLVNLELDAVRLPGRYMLLKAEAPDDMQVKRIDVSSLPDAWTADLAISRSAGDGWLEGGESALLEVPSAIVPDTFNILFNPLHPEAGRMRVVWQQAYPFDRRLFKVRR